jgi:hypothetical protein
VGRQPAPAVTRRLSLAPHELEPIERMADGLNDVEVSERLSLSAKTVRRRLHECG